MKILIFVRENRIHFLLFLLLLNHLLGGLQRAEGKRIGVTREDGRGVNIAVHDCSKQLLRVCILSACKLRNLTNNTLNILKTADELVDVIILVSKHIDNHTLLLLYLSSRDVARPKTSGRCLDYLERLVDLGRL